MDKRRFLKPDFVRVGVLTALCLALGTYLIVTTVVISKDGVFYIGQARSFAGDPLGVARRHSLGYPFLLWIAHAAARLVTGRDSVPLWIYASQAVTLLCRALALVALYLLGKRLIGGTKAFWAILILILLPYPAQYGSDVLRDWPYVLFLGIGFGLLYWALQRRTWWMFALVGLDAAAGYSIQPASAQLVLYGLLGLAVVLVSRPRESRLGPLIAAVLLIAGFAAPVVPYACATGTLVPPQWKRSTFNSAPVITSVGGRGAGRDPLEFEVREGEMLEIGITAFDAQNDELAFSLAVVPVGCRPVYEFRLTASADRFATISEDERNMLLEMFPPDAREYGGIAYYAYAQADARAALEPVHRFWSPVRQRHFYTISPSEKDAILAESPKGLWAYEGIAFYAFAQGRQPPDALPVHRFWSEQAGHLWAVVGRGAGTSPIIDGNMAEQIGTVPNKQIGTVPNKVDDGVAWYVHVAGEPPAGMSLEGKTLRWQPSAGQHGQYQVNITVSDGQLESCQLVKITVHEGPVVQRPIIGSAPNMHGTPRGGSGKRSLPMAGPFATTKARGLYLFSAGPSVTRVAPPNSFDGAAWIEPDLPRPDGQTSLPVPPFVVAATLNTYCGLDGAARVGHAYAGAGMAPGCGTVLMAPRHGRLGELPAAADKLFDGFAESLMVFFLAPWGVGLYCRMRYGADRLERVLMTALIVVNAGLILGRYMWISPETERRYCLGLVAMTIFYVPVGLEQLARWLSWRAALPDRRRSIWFHVLAVVGIGICLPKLLTPLYADKDSYLEAIEWLRDHTQAGDVIASPDIRLTFYAQRPGLPYRNDVDPRRADYVVRIAAKDTSAAPSDWSQEYSAATHDRRGRVITIYKTHRRRD